MSSKDAGKKLCAINKIDNTEVIHPLIDKMMESEIKKLKREHNNSMIVCVNILW